jgi:hypothetical protein
MVGNKTRRRRDGIEPKIIGLNALLLSSCPIPSASCSKHAHSPMACARRSDDTAMRGQASFGQEKVDSNSRRIRKCSRTLGSAGWKTLLLWALTQCYVHVSDSGAHASIPHVLEEAPAARKVGCSGQQLTGTTGLTGGLVNMLRMRQGSTRFGLCLRGGGMIEDTRAARRAERQAKRKPPKRVKDQSKNAQPWRYQIDEEVTSSQTKASSCHSKNNTILCLLFTDASSAHAYFVYIYAFMH